VEGLRDWRENTSAALTQSVPIWYGLAMDAVTYTQARQNFSATMKKVCDDHAPLIITRQSEPPVVMMSLEDYNAMEETFYLMRSPENAKRLSKAISDIKAGQKVEAHDLLS
jgi:antitoxin YefM